MSTKKLIRYLKETNAMFNQEDLKITHQLIQDEVRILKLRSDKYIRIFRRKRPGRLCQANRDLFKWLHVFKGCQRWPNRALYQPVSPEV